MQGSSCEWNTGCARNWAPLQCHTSRKATSCYILKCLACCRYPHCLDFLELLQRPEFRSAIANPNYKVSSYAE